VCAKFSARLLERVRRSRQDFTLVGNAEELHQHRCGPADVCLGHGGEALDIFIFMMQGPRSLVLKREARPGGVRPENEPKREARPQAEKAKVTKKLHVVVQILFQLKQSKYDSIYKS
jgi:hypothetical protein